MAEKPVSLCHSRTGWSEKDHLLWLDGVSICYYGAAIPFFLASIYIVSVDSAANEYQASCLGKIGEMQRYSRLCILHNGRCLSMLCQLKTPLRWWAPMIPTVLATVSAYAMIFFFFIILQCPGKTQLMSCHLHVYPRLSARAPRMQGWWI